MRKYQRKLVNGVATLYRSNDPLRWVYIGIRLNASRQMTDRERRIFVRRMVSGAKSAVKAIGEALGLVAKAAADVIQTLAKALSGNNLHIDHISTKSMLPGLVDGEILNTRIVDGAVNANIGGLSVKR